MKKIEKNTNHYDNLVPRLFLFRREEPANEVVIVTYDMENSFGFCDVYNSESWSGKYDSIYSQFKRLYFANLL
jgi:hypothetical protein